MRRDEERVDVVVRDREAEVVADEAPSDGARVSVTGTRILRDPVHLLLGLVGIPRELRETHVPADRDGSGSATKVLVGLKGDVDAGIRVPPVRLDDRRVVGRAVRPAVVEGDSEGPAATDGWNWSVDPVFASSLTSAGVDQVAPPSVDCVK